MINALTVDVEDWYQGIETIGHSNWHLYESRILNEITKVLNILGEYKVNATFFILGYVAEKFPQLVERIAKYGHEIATHGYSHQLVYNQSVEEFTEDLKKSLEVIEKITGTKIIGYRAPLFTITEKSLWALNILKQHGMKYDSSIFPIRNYLYGIPDAPRYPYSVDNGLVEFPISTVKFLGKSIPFSGGFYLRFMPYWFIKWAIKKINSRQKPVVVYLHPFELDLDIPKLGNIPFKRRFAHYHNIKTTENKLRNLLEDFEFCPMKKVLLL